MNRLYPAEARLKEGANARDSDQIRWELFPCRGLVAPCQRADSSIERRRFDVNRGAVEPTATSLAFATTFLAPRGREVVARIVRPGDMCD